METIYHIEFKDDMLYESSFSEVDFDFAKKIHRSNVMWNQEFLQKRMEPRRAKTINKLLTLMGKGETFTRRVVIKTSEKVEY